LTINKPNFVVLTCLLPFLVSKRSRVLIEKKVNETQVSKTVFSHLNEVDIVQDCPTLAKNTLFSHDDTAALLVSQNNELTAMLVYETNPVGVELFSSNKFAAGHVSKFKALRF